MRLRCAFVRAASAAAGSQTDVIGHWTRQLAVPSMMLPKVMLKSLTTEIVVILPSNAPRTFAAVAISLSIPTLACQNSSRDSPVVPFSFASPAMLS
jgi:hypothetical protein